jgi:hypothetical protein
MLRKSLQPSSCTKVKDSFAGEKIEVIYSAEDRSAGEFPGSVREQWRREPSKLVNAFTDSGFTERDLDLSLMSFFAYFDKF